MTNDSLMVYVFLASLAGLYLLVRKVTSATDPSRVFLLPWMLSISFIAFGVVVYDQVFTLTTFLSLLASIIAFACGCLTYRNLRPQRLSGSFGPLVGFSPYLSLALVSLTLGYCLLQFLEFRSVFQSLTSESPLQELRTLHWQQYQAGSKSVADIGRTLLRPAAIIVFLAGSYYARTRNFSMLLVCAAAFAALATETLMHGGRFLIVFLLAGTVYIWYMLRRFEIPTSQRQARLPRAVRIGAAATAAILVTYQVFVVFPAARNPALTENVGRFMSLQHDVRMSDWIFEVSREHAPTSLPIFVYGTAYLSLPIPKYAYFDRHAPIGEWRYFGEYNFPVFANIGSIASGSRGNWLDIRRRIASVATRDGYGANPWSTGVRDLVIDFGYVGAALIFWIIGFAAQWLYQSAVDRGQMTWVVAAGLSGVGCMIFAFLSPFVIGYTLNTIIYLVILNLLARLLSIASDRWDNPAQPAVDGRRP